MYVDFSCVDLTFIQAFEHITRTHHSNTSGTQESDKDEDAKKTPHSLSKDSILSISTVNSYLTNLNKRGAKPFAQRLICDTSVLEYVMKTIQIFMESIKDRRRIARRASRHACGLERSPRVIIKALYHFVGAVVVNSTYVMS